MEVTISHAGGPGYQQSTTPGHFYVSAPHSTPVFCAAPGLLPLPSAPWSEHILSSTPMLQACFLLSSRTPNLFCARGKSAPVVHGILSKRSRIRRFKSPPAFRTPRISKAPLHTGLQACFFLNSSAPNPPSPPHVKCGDYRYTNAPYSPAFTGMPLYTKPSIVKKDRVVSDVSACRRLFGDYGMLYYLKFKKMNNDVVFQY